MSTSAIRRPTGYPNTYASVASGQIRHPRNIDPNQIPTTSPNQLPYGGPLYPSHILHSSTTLGFIHDDSTHASSPIIPAYLADTAFTDHLAQLKPTNEETQPPLPTTCSFLGKAPQIRNPIIETIENNAHTTKTILPFLPTRFNEHDKSNAVEVLSDGLEVRFQGATKNDSEAGTVRADHPVPAKCGIFYFEISVFSKGKEGMIGVGFCEKVVDLQRLPGWEAKSWGYHGDDGKAFGRNGNGQGESYGPPFSSGDTIGCGINTADNTAFFTKNGTFLGTAFRDLKGTLYPSVGMQKDPEHIRANFGQERFVFDIESHIRAEKLRIYEETISKAAITSITSKLDEPSFIQTLVSSYLAHEGYVGTLRALTEEFGEESKKSSKTAMYNLSFIDGSKADADVSRRQSIRNAILNGNIDEAMNLTETHYPGVIKNNENIHFRLRCRRLKEMVAAVSPAAKSTAANGKSKELDLFDQDMELDEPSGNEWERMDMTNENSLNKDNNELLEEAVLYTNQLSAEFNTEDDPEKYRALHDAFSLINYTNPRKSALFEQDGRKAIAEDLNSAILVSQGRHSVSALGRLVQQTAVLVDETSNNGGAASLINVQRDFLSGQSSAY